MPLVSAAPSPPAGFTVIGSDSAGTPVFVNGAGVLYQWTGTGMQIFSGQLATNSGMAAQLQAAIQSALAQGQSAQQAAQAALATAQSQGVPVTPALQAQVADQTVAAATAPRITEAGIGGGLSGTTGLLAVAGVLGLMFVMSRRAKG
jgi:hypothetical protein